MHPRKIIMLLEAFFWWWCYSLLTLLSKKIVPLMLYITVYSSPSKLVNRKIQLWVGHLGLLVPIKSAEHLEEYERQMVTIYVQFWKMWREVLCKHNALKVWEFVLICSTGYFSRYFGSSEYEPQKVLKTSSLLMLPKCPCEVR